MNRRLEVTGPAQADIDAAHAWYTAIGKDLGNAFRGAVGSLLQQIVTSPEMYPVRHGAVRQALVHRFPYSVSYLVQPDAVVVIACLHARRDPRLLEYRRKGSRS